jgi:L-amino acid N-acyltransferase YncA
MRRPHARMRPARHRLPAGGVRVARGRRWDMGAGMDRRPPRADTLRLRDAAPADAPCLAAIYAHHVVNGFASFDTHPPAAGEFERRIAQVTGAGWPWLVAAADGAVVGYAYACPIRDRPGYRFTCEDSIYVAQDWRGRGVGRRLLAALILRCEAAGFRQMVAVVGGGEPASLALHARLGFAEVGRLRAVGWKLGAWRDSVYLQRSLGPGDASPPAPDGQDAPGAPGAPRAPVCA